MCISIIWQFFLFFFFCYTRWTALKWFFSVFKRWILNITFAVNFISKNRTRINTVTYTFRTYLYRIHERKFEDELWWVFFLSIGVVRKLMVHEVKLSLQVKTLHTASKWRVTIVVQFAVFENSVTYIIISLSTELGNNDL